MIEDPVDVNYEIDEPVPLIKFKTETNKRYASAILVLVKWALWRPTLSSKRICWRVICPSSLRTMSRRKYRTTSQFRSGARGETSSEDKDGQGASERAMTVGGCTLTRNPPPHEIKASVDSKAWMRTGLQLNRVSLVQRSEGCPDRGVSNGDRRDGFADLEAPAPHLSNGTISTAGNATHIERARKLHADIVGFGRREWRRR